LKRLDLSSNKFTGNIPQSIGESKRLKHLDLSSNKFTGNIPQSIGELQELEYLDLSDNNLNHANIPINEIESLKKLKFLKFDGDDCTEVPSLHNTSIECHCTELSLNNTNIKCDEITIPPPSPPPTMLSHSFMIGSRLAIAPLCMAIVTAITT